MGDLRELTSLDYDSPLVVKEPTKAKDSPTAKEIIAVLAKRLGVDGHAVISREEWQVLSQFVAKAELAKSHLEASENPFYKGMELLNQINK